MSEPYTITAPSVDLASLRRSFEGIPIDPYLSGGCRGRALSRFEVKDGTLRRLDWVSFYQSSHVNSLENYGGISRTYPELPAWLDDEPALLTLFRHWLAQFGLTGGLVSVHQIRTLVGGDPVPEGRHRDGYRYIGVYVVDRQNVDPRTGLTGVWDLPTGEALLEDHLLAPGTLLAFDDRRVVHDATPVEALDGSAPGHRDVMILTLPDHHYVGEHGEIPVDETASAAGGAGATMPAGVLRFR